MEIPILNAHNKLEYEPAHSCEHLLNATMVKMFGCPRSRNAHVEKKKSKCDYTLRIVRIGDYDACACIGAHVRNTSEIGTFKIISHSYAEGIWRLRWKVVV